MRFACLLLTGLTLAQILLPGCVLFCTQRLKSGGFRTQGLQTRRITPDRILHSGTARCLGRISERILLVDQASQFG